MLGLSDDSVAHAEVGHEVHDGLMVRMGGVLEMLEKGFILKVEVGYLLVGCISALSCIRRVRIMLLTSVDAIGEGTNAHLLELHQVACECASFIRKDIVDLAELLIQVRCLHLGPQVLSHVVDLCVPLDKLGLEELHHLHGHYQGDRDKVAIGG